MTTTTVLSHLTGDYQLDVVHSRIGFVARHAMITKVHGHFAVFDGRAQLDGADPSRSSAQVVIQADSIQTGNNIRDEHLRGNDFLDVPHHPTIEFSSHEVRRLSGATFRVTGDLTIRGTTRPLSIDLEFTGAMNDPYGNFRAGFEGTVTINRKDWGVSWNAALESGGVLVGEKVTIELDIAVVRQP